MITSVLMTSCKHNSESPHSRHVKVDYVGKPMLSFSLPSKSVRDAAMLPHSDMSKADLMGSRVMPRGVGDFWGPCIMPSSL